MTRSSNLHLIQSKILHRTHYTGQRLFRMGVCNPANLATREWQPTQICHSRRHQFDITSPNAPLPLHVPPPFQDGRIVCYQHSSSSLQHLTCVIDTLHSAARFFCLPRKEPLDPWMVLVPPELGELTQNLELPLSQSQFIHVVIRYLPPGEKRLIPPVTD